MYLDGYAHSYIKGLVLRHVRLEVEGCRNEFVGVPCIYV